MDEKLDSAMVSTLQQKNILYGGKENERTKNSNDKEKLRRPSK